APPMRRFGLMLLMRREVLFGSLQFASASCLPSEITAISATGTSLPPYSPFTLFTPKLVTVTVSAARACAVELAFLATNIPAKLVGTGSLSYDVQLPSSSTSLLYVGTLPVTTAHIDIGTSLVGSASVQISIP